MTTSAEMKSAVREKYSEIAEQRSAGCCGSSCGCDEDIVLGEDYNKLAGYNPDADLHLGCGIPMNGAGIKSGDVVLDLGSGAGNDVFIASRSVGETGRVIGVDMTEAMIKRANENRAKLGYRNVEFRLGDIEELPIESGTVDVVLSNCVLNLVPNKERAFSEIFRVLKPGGHFSISDIVSTMTLPDKLRNVSALYTGCVSGAVAREVYLDMISKTGFVNVEVRREVETPTPQEIFSELSHDESMKFKSSGTAILSLTVQGEKPTRRE